MRRLLFWLLGVALFLGALILGWKLAAANATPLNVDLIGITLEGVRVWQLVLASMATGGGVVGLGASILGARGWLLRVRYRSTIRLLESELHQMRSLPLAGATEALRTEERGAAVLHGESPGAADGQV